MKKKLQKRVVCLVEKNWQDIRRLTIALAKEHIYSECIIKGKLEQEVLEMITQYDEICLISIRRRLFRLYIVAMFLKNFFLQNTICIVTNGKKNYPWVSAINNALGIKTLLLIEESDELTLFLDRRPLNIKFILNLARKRNENCFGL